MPMVFLDTVISSHRDVAHHTNLLKSERSAVVKEQC